MKKVRLGDLLVKNQVLTEAQIQEALNEQRETGRMLGNVLIDLGLMDETSLLNFLAKQLGLPFIELKNYPINYDVVKMVPETLARRFRVIPIDIENEHITLGMVDPTDLVALDEISRRLSHPIDVVIVREFELLRTLDEAYKRKEEITNLIGELIEDIHIDDQIQEIGNDPTDIPILKLLYSILEDAVELNASDIHIEPDNDLLRIRHRVDGALQEQVLRGRNIISALILRLKLMARLNISEKRLPQDGRFSVKVKGRKIDIRISTMPIQSGESVVLRLLDQSEGIMKLEQLGMPLKIQECLQKYLQKSLGMIIVTGPTGSGKSTTLYAGLSDINNAKKKIITVEDPVEYTFSRVNQVQVQPKIGLNFSQVLRSALRHDPDVVMVGEIRDEETAMIALRAAMTGHLVLTTLHTNDVLSTPSRLLEMGMPPFLVASALKLIMAQRLVRKICTHCAVTYEPTVQELTYLSSLMQANVDKMSFLKGRGCKYCHLTGYKGRIGIYEVVEMNADMVEAIRESDINRFVEAAKKNPLYRPLTNWALDYACQGITTIEEVLRLANELDM